MIKILFRLSFFVLLVTVFSCEKGSITQCSDCSAEEPENVELTIYIDDPLSSSSSTIIRIYEGLLEDGILIKSYSFQGREATYFEAKVNKMYTITATYTISNRIYTAVDSTIPKVRYEPDMCDEPCYFVHNKTLNLRLKYQ
jgi:hypothetical protein